MRVKELIRQLKNHDDDDEILIHRDDGKAQCGMIVSGWFIFNKTYFGDPKMKLIDVQKYILKAKEV